jgi:hypothetical protein
LYGGCGDERRSFGSVNGASLGIVVVRKIAVYDECHLERGYLALSETLWFFRFGSIPHFFKNELIG